MANEALELRNPTALWHHLKEQGYRVGRSTIYEHAAQGKLRPNQDGVYTESEIRAYLKIADLPLKSGRRPRADMLQERKARAEVARIEAQARLMTLKRDVMAGEYIKRSVHEQDLADRARLLRASLFNFFRIHVDDLIGLAGGDPARAAEVLAYCEERLEDWLDAYARAGEITVEPPQ